VERALRLIATGTLTIDVVHAAKGKTLNLPKTMNLAINKEPTRQTGFSDASWGKATRDYAKSAARLLSTAKFNAIIKEAKGFVKPVHGCKMTQTETIDVDEDDEWACLACNSDDEMDQLA
jgi:hypothetical protein